MDDLRITLVQAETRWHDPAANRALYGDLVRSVAGRSDLVVLPETLTSGFTNETVGNAEGPDGDERGRQGVIEGGQDRLRRG